MIKPFYILVFLSFFACQPHQKTDAEKNAISNMVHNKKVETKTIVKKGYVKKGQGFFQALHDLGLDHKTSLAIINALRDEIEFSKLKVNDQLEAHFEKEQIKRFIFSNTPAEQHILSLNQQTQSFVYNFKQMPTLWKYREINGQLKSGSTLQEDLSEQGLSSVTAAEAINALICKINFRYHARPGDTYKLLLHDRHYNGQIIQTKVLYTYYQGSRAGESETYFFDDGEKSTYTAHYTKDGQALIRSGLRYPLNRLHIRSHYGMRRHPVTGHRVMHRGVDLRARKGASVHAVARGVVTESSYHPFGGNKIVIRHADGSRSYYLHLNNRNVKKGQLVRSFQVIGTVGATGRVTGPHLHFGFRKANGRWMNPMNKRMIATPKLAGQRYAELQNQIKEIQNTLLAIKYQAQGRGQYVFAVNPKQTAIDVKEVLSVNI